MSKASMSEKEELIAKDCIERSARNLNTNLQLLTYEDHAAILMKRMVLEPEYDKILREFYRLFVGASKAREHADKLGDKKRTEVESELLSFLYFLIFVDLKERDVPCANYYCDLSYNGNTIRDSQQKTPYEYAKFYEYAKNIEKASIISKATLQTSCSIYIAISQSNSLYKEQAALKVETISQNNFKELKECLEKVKKGKNSELIKLLAEEEESWLNLSDYAKSFKSDDSRLQELLDYIKETTIAEHPNLHKHFEVEATKTLLLENEENLMLLLKTAEESRAKILPPQAISQNKTTKAFVIYYSNLEQGNPNYFEKQRYFIKSLKENDPDALHDMYQNYEKYKDENKIDEFNDPEMRKLYDSFSQRTKQQYLEESAWRGKPLAQYQLYQTYKTELANQESKPIQDEEKIRTLKERCLYFVSLSATNGCADGQYEYANMLDSGEIFSENAPGLQFLYYAKAAFQGHEQSIAKIESVLAISKVSDENFEALRNAANYIDDAGLALACCLCDDDTNAENYEIGVAMLERFSGQSPEADLRLAIHNLDKKSEVRSLLKTSVCKLFLENLLNFENLTSAPQEYRASTYSAAFAILDNSAKASSEYLTTSEKKSLKALRSAAIKIIEFAATENNLGAKIRFAISMQEAGEKEKKTEALALLIDVFVENSEAKTLDEKELSWAAERINKLLESNPLPQDLIFSQIETLCALSMTDKARFTLAKRIIELASYEEKKADLQKIVVQLTEQSAGSYDPAKSALASYFCDKSYVPSDIKHIQNFRKYKIDIGAAQHIEIAKRIYEIGNSLDEASQKLCKKEFLYHYGKSSETKALEGIHSSWIAKSAPDQVRKEKESASAVQAPSSPQQGEVAAQKTPKLDQRARKAAAAKKALEQQKAAAKAADAEARAANAAAKSAELEEAKRVEAEAEKQDMLARMQAAEEKRTQTEAAKLARAEEAAAGEMEAFLQQKERTIDSIKKLPKFLQYYFETLLKNEENKCIIALKGSAIYQGRESCIIPPADLDIEIYVDKLAKKSDEDIKSFVAKHFKVAEDMVLISKGAYYKAGGHNYFTVSVKDDRRKLDISLYDIDNLPEEELSWTTNQETRILFDKDGNASHPKPIDPQDFNNQHLPEAINKLRGGIDCEKPFSEPKHDPSKEFTINQNSHKLILRLALLKTNGGINRDQFSDLLSKMRGEIGYRLPIYFLPKELKIDKNPALQSYDYKCKTVRDSVNNFMDSHFLETESKSEFISTLLKLALIVRLSDVHAAPDPSHKIIISTLKQMRRENEKEQPPQDVKTTPAAKQLAAASHYQSQARDNS